METPQIPSGMLVLDKRDFIRGAAVSMCSAVIVALGGVFVKGFDLWGGNWHDIINIMFVAAFGGLSGYIGKSFLSDSKGRFLGKV